MTEPVNFRTVDVAAKIFRGGQPNSLSEWEFVYSLGVRQIVKLNLESEAQDSTWFTFGGTDLVYCPINNWQQLVTEPELSSVLTALDAMRVPTYVHCEHGVNRTGLLVALYRIKFQGWEPLAAQQEWHAGGAIPIEQEGLEKAFQDIVFHDEYFRDSSAT